MNFDLRDKVKLHNHYEVDVIGPDGIVKQHAVADNIVLNNFWTMLSRSAYSVYGIAMGTGTGTPAATDTALFNQKFIYDGGISKLAASEAFPTCAYTYKTTVPASASYVGELTEIGIRGRYNPSSWTSILWTHALLKDTEGNPITITKTDIDVLTVTLTIYLTLSATDENFHWLAPSINALCTFFRNPGTSYTLFTSKQLMHCRSVILDDDDCIYSFDYPEGCNIGSSTYDATTKTMAIATTRLGADVGNTNFLNGLVVAGIGGYVYPNSALFANSTIENIRIGTGDGETTVFDVPIEYFIQGSETVKVDGVAQVRTVDYAIDNFNPAEAQNGSMTISNYLKLVPYTDLPIYSKSSTMTALLSRFNNITEYECCLRSEAPLIYEVVEQCPSQKLTHMLVENICLVTNYSWAGLWESDVGRNLIEPHFYETRPNKAFKVYVGTESEVLAQVVAALDDQAHSNTIGDFICILGGLRLIQQVSNDLYYYIENAVGSTSQRLCWIARGSGVRPWSGFATNRTYYNNWKGADRTVNGEAWSFGSVSLSSVSISQTPYMAQACSIDNYKQMYAGCYLRISGGQSRSGPWTLLKEVELSSLPELSTSSGESSNRYTRCGIQSIDETFDDVTYSHYKVELDISEATDIRLADPSTRLFVNPMPTVDILCYAGKKLRFAVPPAADAPITMDCRVDRPFKNSNFVIDTSVSMQFGGGA